MKSNPIATRAVVGMLPTLALLATPAWSQDAAQPATPPAPVVVTPPPAPAPAAPAATGPSAEDRAKFEASATAATGTATTETESAPVTTTRRAPSRPAARPAARAAAPARVTRAPVAAAPVAAAPVAAAPARTETTPAATPSSTPTASETLPAAPMTTPVPDEPTAATDGQTTTTETTTTERNGVPVWAWVLGGLALLAAIAAFIARRRRRTEDAWEQEAVYEEPVREEPARVAPTAAAPLAAAPLAAAAPASDAVVEEHAEVAAPAADEVAAITAGSAPVDGRPWIELSLRPLRAGSTDDAATVEVELTLANAGEIAAREVRVSTFLLGDAGSSTTEMERQIAGSQGGTEVRVGEIGAGEGSRVDATLAVARAELDGATFQPVVVADVRYTLPDGREGRTAAAFAIGVDDGTEEPTPLRLGGDLREDVTATLHGVLERA